MLEDLKKTTCQHNVAYRGNFETHRTHKKFRTFPQTEGQNPLPTLRTTITNPEMIRMEV